IYITTREGKFVDINQAGLELFGYTKEEIMSLNVQHTYIDRNDRAKFQQEIEKRGFVRDFEIKFCKKDGTEIDCLVTAILQRANNGSILGYQGIIRNITERKRAEEALQESKEKYRNLVESISDVVYAIDSSGVLTYISPVVKNTLGYEPDELIGKQFLEFVHKEDHDLLMRRFSEFYGGIVRHIDYRVIGKQGDIKWVRTLTNPIIEEGGFVGGRGVIIDITERKRAEEAVRDAFNRWQSSVDGIKDSIFLLDKEGVIFQINKNAAKLFGKTEKEIQGHHCWEIVHGTSEPIAGCPIVRMKQSKQRETMLLPVDDKWYEVTVDPLLNQDGNLLGAVHIISDITERKRAEEVLRESEEKFRTLVEGLSEAVYRMTLPDGIYNYFSPSVREIFGYSAEDFLNRPLFIKEIIHPDFVKYFEGKWSDLIEGNVPTTYEYKIIDPGGNERWILQSNKGIFNNQGNIIAIEGLCRNITERKKAEEALRESEERYRSLFKNMLNGYAFCKMLFDKENKPVDFIYIDVNDAFEKLTGLRKEDVIGKRVTEVIPSIKDLNPELIPTYGEVASTGKPAAFEVFFKPLDIWLTISAYSPHKDYFVAIFDNITERKRMEEARERLMADLEAKNKEMEAFVYTISHDLKAPLVSLNGFSGALQKEYESQLGEEGRHYLERIQANVAHMEALIKSLLELSRIGQVVGAIEEIDVAAMLREIRDRLAVRLKEAEAEFVVQEPLPTVCADRGRIHQVFANLIENAVKFRSAERPLRIEVGCRQESGFYRFHVADNGIGIAPQYHEQIFTPFRKLHPEIEGVGIGLALVKKIVEHHGGRAWVESEAGKGSTFYFTIPITSKQ
ncbi:MAG: PAS domain S-box protein, partial [Pseudomonadota bacterium]